MHAYHEVLSFNSMFILPFMAILYFSNFFTSEYSNRTIYIMQTSVHSIGKIFLAKFIMAAISFSLIFIISNIIIISIISFISDNGYITVGNYFTFTVISFKDLLVSIITVIILLNIHYLAWGALSMLISSLIKKGILATLLSIALFISFTVIPIPNQIRNFTFIDGGSSSIALFGLNSSVVYLLQIGISSIAYILIFVWITIVYIEKRPNYWGRI